MSDPANVTKTDRQTQTQSETQSPPLSNLPTQIPPALIARFHDYQQQQPQQWEYFHRTPSKRKLGLGVNERTGRLQWCPGLTCCKFLVIIPVIMLPVMLVLILLMRMDGMLFALKQADGAPNEEQPYYIDDYVDNSGRAVMDDIVSENLKLPVENPLSKLNEMERLKRCISFRFHLSEKDTMEDHDILKDARTSFLPLDTTAIPRECLEHKNSGNGLGGDYEEFKVREIRKRRRRTSGDNARPVGDPFPVDYEIDMDEDDSFSISKEYEDPSITETVSALQNFWGDKSNKNSIRETQARTMLKYMDPKIDPCTDFYKYACGNWENLHPIPRDKAGFDTFEMLRENLDLVLKDLLESSENNSRSVKHAHKQLASVPNNDFEPKSDTQADIVPRTLQDSGTTKPGQEQLRDKSEALIKHIIAKRDVLARILRRYRRQSKHRKQKRLLRFFSSSGEGTVHDEDAVRKARDFYKSCTNTRVIQRRGIKPLLSLIKSFGGWPVLDPNWEADKFDWLNVTANLRRYNNDIFIVEWVGPDIKNSDENIIQFDQTSLGLPTREYFLQNINVKYLRAYQLFMSAVMQGLGATQEAADQTATQLITFETKLAAITSPAEQRLNVTKLYKRMSLYQLQKTVPQIDWLRYLQILQDREVRGSEQVVIYALDYMHKLVSLVDATDKRIISNYLLWRFIRHRINNVDDRFEDSKQNFYHALFGREESPSRWKICIAQVNTNMGMALGSLFVRRYFDENSKLDTLKMTHELQQAFRDILKTTDWLDPTTKHLAELKVNAMSLKIGYPDFILDSEQLNEKYKGIVIHPDKYFENTLNVLLHTAKTEQLKLHEAVNKTTWQTAPAIVNAYYSRNKNQIMFPAGILQPPFYHRHFPRSLNFGGIGVVIGHELTHGFDDKGRLFDRNGSIHKWWTDASIKGFDERARCIIAQYSNYTVEEIGVTLNGESTQGENIADNGGIRQAFHAYKRWLHENPKEAVDEHLPGINMTGEQLFFLNFGQVWCGAMRPEAVRNKLNTAIHSPGRFRVIGTVSNSVDFAREFKCASGTPMNPTHKCSVW